MSDIYLRAADEASMTAALIAASIVDETGRTGSPLIAVDIIGQDPVRPVTAEVLTGFHANLYVDVDLSAEQLAILAPVTIAPPNTPLRVRA